MPETTKSPHQETESGAFDASKILKPFGWIFGSSGFFYLVGHLYFQGVLSHYQLPLMVSDFIPFHQVVLQGAKLMGLPVFAFLIFLQLKNFLDYLGETKLIKLERYFKLIISRIYNYESKDKSLSKTEDYIRFRESLLLISLIVFIFSLTNFNEILELSLEPPAIIAILFVLTLFLFSFLIKENPAAFAFLYLFSVVPFILHGLYQGLFIRKQEILEIISYELVSNDYWLYFFLLLFYLAGLSVRRGFI